MSTFTDKELIKEIKERIGSLDVRDNIERRAYEIALASLEAEPVAWMRDDADGREYNARNEFSGGGGVPLYATPPVPVVPEEKPMPNPLSMYAVDAVAAIAEVRGWNACRAAMLHGAEPASNHEELPLDYLQGQKMVLNGLRSLQKQITHKLATGFTMTRWSWLKLSEKVLTCPNSMDQLR